MRSMHPLLSSTRWTWDSQTLSQSTSLVTRRTAARKCWSHTNRWWRRSARLAGWARVATVSRSIISQTSSAARNVNSWSRPFRLRTYSRTQASWHPQWKVAQQKHHSNWCVKTTSQQHQGSHHSITRAAILNRITLGVSTALLRVAKAL